MEALISGSAGLLAISIGADFELTRYDDDSDAIVLSKAEVLRIFSVAYDTERVVVPSREKAQDILRRRGGFDQALLLIQALSRAQNEKRKRSIISEISLLFKLEMVFEDVTNFVYAVPALGVDLPVCVEEEQEKTFQFLAKLSSAQESIGIVRNAFDRFLPAVFPEQERLSEWERVAIERGIFFSFVSAIEEGTGMSAALLAAYSLMNDQNSSREAISAWTKSWGSLKKVPREKPTSIAHANTYFADAQESVHDRKASVRRQIEGIEAQLTKGDIIKARLFAQQLVDYQIRNDDGTAFAAKSLCNLAQQARLRGFDELQLEWLHTAVQIAPTDGWAAGQMGDAFLSRNLFAEAEPLFVAASNLGEQQFGLCALGRLYRASGHYERSLFSFRQAKHDYPDHPDAPWAWHGEAETLRDIWEYDQAIAVYQDAASRFPDQVISRCGYASSLKDSGRLPEAEAEYRNLFRTHKDDPYVINGLADVLRLRGALDEALALFQQASLLEPDSALPLCGAADTYRAMRRPADAMSLFKHVVQRFPHNPHGIDGLAQSLRDGGNIDEALAHYEEASVRFAFNLRIRDSRAQMLGFAHQYSKALQAFDENIRDFPLSLRSHMGRANMLKRLGHFHHACEAFRHVLSRRPTYARAKYSLAAVLVIMKEYEEADNLLMHLDAPSTADEWFGFQIRASILSKKGMIPEAISLLERGVQINPFYRSRENMRLSLAAVYLLRGRTEEAAICLQEQDAPISKVLSLHLFGMLGDVERATSCFRAVNDNEVISTSLKEEMKERFVSRMKGPRYSAKWLLDEETNLILQAA